MNLIDAIILGIVEGVTEFLPVSSTGHLILASKLLHLPATEFLKSFEITIQFGAILAVVVLYWKLLLVNLEVMKRVLTAFLPTAVLGFILYKVIKKFLLGNSSVVLWSLFLGGIILIVFERWNSQNVSRERSRPFPTIDDISKMSYQKAFWIGVIQSLAMIPGVSRSAATIVGGMILGLERKAIVEFSFLLAVPTMLAATALDLLKNADSFSSDQFGFLCLGFIVSFAVAMASIRWLLSFIKNHNFIPFGIYRIAVVLLLVIGSLLFGFIL